MSAYHGRMSLNFSQYITDLNAVPQPYDQEFLPTEDLNLEQELALFTNTDFTEFDSIGPMPDDGLNFDVGDNTNSAENGTKVQGLLTNPTSPSTAALQSGDSYYTNYPHRIQPAPSLATYSESASFSPPVGSSPISPDPPHSAALKRKVDVIASASPQPILLDQQSRLAAEEDKRRRNTAASARFRVKKKQREQALERTVKEVNDKNTALEAKIKQLQMENIWLKDLVTEKNGKQTKEEIARAYQRFRKQSEEYETTKDSERREDIESQP